MKQKLDPKSNLDSMLGRMGGDISVLNKGVGVLKTDISILKTDVGVLKVDVASLKKDVKYLKESAVSTAIQLKQLDTKIDTESAETRRQMLGFKDEILSKLQPMHQELTMLGGQFRRCENGLEDHDKRICRLETKVFVKAAS